jgi:hypothetical protein
LTQIINHLKRKYSINRVYSQNEVQERGWHGPRATFDPQKLVSLLSKDLILYKEDGEWNRSDPRIAHPFFGN